MGSKCSSCTDYNKNIEIITEILSNNDLTSASPRALNPKHPRTPSSKYNNYISQVVKIQKFWRKHRAKKHKARRSCTLEILPHISDSQIFLSSPNFKLPIKKEKRQPFRFSNGAVHIGEWMSNFKHGKGIQTWPDGARYEGEWRYNKAHGYGKFWHADGDIYDGQWKDDKANGRGVYRQTNGACYEGSWKDDVQNGFGTETWADGSKYEGNYLDVKISIHLSNQIFY